MAIGHAKVRDARLGMLRLGTSYLFVLNWKPVVLAVLALF